MCMWGCSAFGTSSSRSTRGIGVSVSGLRTKQARRTASGKDDDDVFLSLGDEEGAQLPPQSVAFVENGIGGVRARRSVAAPVTPLQSEIEAAGEIGRRSSFRPKSCVTVALSGSRSRRRWAATCTSRMRSRSSRELLTHAKCGIQQQSLSALLAVSLCLSVSLAVCLPLFLSLSQPSSSSSSSFCLPLQV